VVEVVALGVVLLALDAVFVLALALAGALAVFVDPLADVDACAFVESELNVVLAPSSVAAFGEEAPERFVVAEVCPLSVPELLAVALGATLGDAEAVVLALAWLSGMQSMCTALAELSCACPVALSASLPALLPSSLQSGTRPWSAAACCAAVAALRGAGFCSVVAAGCVVAAGLAFAVVLAVVLGLAVICAKAGALRSAAMARALVNWDRIMSFPPAEMRKGEWKFQELWHSRRAEVALFGPSGGGLGRDASRTSGSLTPATLASYSTRETG
jgi:hypothetical protein